MSTRYICVSATCRREMEFEVLQSSISGEGPKICLCGAVMKKVYTPPTFEKLSEAAGKRLFADCRQADMGNKRVAKR